MSRMDRKPSFLGPMTSQGPSTTAFNEDPYGVELDKLDVFNVAENNDFMKSVIEAKKSLIDDAKVMRKLMKLDTFTLDSEHPVLLKSKENIKVIKKARRRIIDDDDEMAELEPSVDENGVSKVITEGSKAEEEDEEEDEVVEEEENEEENDYMDPHFDNGEDYID